jgi:hypothetical protein
MEEARVRRRLLLQDFKATISYPAPDLPSHQGGEHDEEPSSNLVPKDGHGETRLRYCDPGSIRQLLDLDGAESSEAESLEAEHEGGIEDVDEIDEDEQTEVALREVHHGRVEVGPLIECRQDYRDGKAGRYLRYFD